MGGGNGVIILDAVDGIHNNLRSSWNADTYLKRCKNVRCFKVNCSSKALGEQPP